MVLGFASSSCSFAALSATRSLFTKGAALTSALAFTFASKPGHRGATAFITLSTVSERWPGSANS